MLACVVLALVSASCTTEVDYTLGTEYVPSKQNMELKRRVYRMGEWTEGDNSASCQLLTTRLYQTDSIASANLERAYFGAERSDVYGERRAGFMTQMIFGVTLGEERGWGYRPIFDSMVLALYVMDFHGDTTKHHKFNVYEITSNDYFKESEDTTFYINFDPTPYIAREPIFTFEYPNQERGVYVGDMEEPQGARVKLEHTPATREYISRLMFTSDEELSANDGFAHDKEELYVEGNEAKFVEQFKGIYIEPAEEIEGEGAMFATNMENSALILYARSRYKEDPTIIRDTAQMVYNFYVDPAERDMKAGNVSINRVMHDFAGSVVADVENNPEVRVGYVDGMGGVVTEVWFSDEFIQSLADIALSEEDAVVSVNQARLKVYLEGSNYDPLNIDPIKMGEVMNTTMERMGTYASYGSLIGISDYAYGYESSGLEYGGYLNRSLGAYVMDISTCIQSLMMAAQENVDENGKVQLEKFEEGYEPENESLVGYRRIYLGPEAANCFDFKRQAIYGGDYGAESSDTAPITLDLTYTIVR